MLQELRTQAIHAYLDHAIAISTTAASRPTKVDKAEAADDSGMRDER